MNSTKAFFSQFLMLTSSLQDMFPDDADFVTFHTFLNVLQKTNPSMVIKTFYENINMKYSTQIDHKDETFIENYQGGEYDSNVMDIVTKLKSYWSVLSSQSKASLWQYMFVLKELCKRAYVVPA